MPKVFSCSENHPCQKVEHACPMALYFVNKYPKKIAGIICYPFRYYSLESYKRRVWKLKDNKGWESLVKDNKYDVDKRFQELFIKNLSNNDVEKL